MATPAHCLYCFESLASHLEDRPSMTLGEVEASYATYAKTVLENGNGGASASASTATATSLPTSPSKLTKLTKRLPALRRLAASAASSGSSSAGESSTGSSSASSTTDLMPAAGEDTPMTSTSSLPDGGAGEKEPDELEEEDEAEAEAEDPEPLPSPALAAISASPLFVTWNTLTPRDPDGSPALRGCIGTFEAQPLSVGLADYAVTSAVHDTRFPPISRRELPTLQVAVTLLTDFEDCVAGDPFDWELGKHGLRISFTSHGRRYGATYLPDVASEQGWTQEETLVSLMRKAGWMGRRDRWRDVPLKVVRYQGKKASLDYPDFKRWHDWAAAK